MKHGTIQPILGRLLNSDDAFEFDVRVPFDSKRYDARTIISMVKLVNRRGRVRWFKRTLHGYERRYFEQASNVKDVEDLYAFIRWQLDPVERTGNRQACRIQETVIVSFEDRSDARAFVRDLAQLRLLPKTRKRAETA